MGASASRRAQAHAEEEEPALPVARVSVLGDGHARKLLVDRISLGMSQRLEEPPSHPRWEKPSPEMEHKPVMCAAVVGSRVWSLEGGRVCVVLATDGAPSVAKPPHPPAAVATDCAALFLAVSDPSFPAARALSAQVAVLERDALWAAGKRAEAGLEPAATVVVYWRRRGAAGTGRAAAVPGREGTATLLAGVHLDAVPAPVRRLAEGLGAPVRVLDSPRSADDLVRETLGRIVLRLG